MFESVGQFWRDETHPAAMSPAMSVANIPGAGKMLPLSSSVSEVVVPPVESLPPAFGSSTSMVSVVVAPDASVATMTTV